MNPKVPASAPEKRWAVTLMFGTSNTTASNNPIDILSSLEGPSKRDDFFVGAAVDYRLFRFWRDFAVDVEGGTGYRWPGSNGGEFWGTVYLRYDGFFWNHILYTSLGVNTGLDVVTRLSPLERATEHHSYLLHYIGPELAFALPDRRDWQFVIRWHHRSGIFGTINDTWHGSNVIAWGVRHWF